MEYIALDSNDQDLLDDLVEDMYNLQNKIMAFYAGVIPLDSDFDIDEARVELSEIKQQIESLIYEDSEDDLENPF